MISRFTRFTLFFSGALFLGIICYFYIDFPLSMYFQTHRYHALLYVSQGINIVFFPTFHLILWPTLFLIFFVVCRKRKASSFLRVGLAIAFTMAIIESLKIITGRARPEIYFSSQFYGFTFFSLNPLFFSFPSGHAGTIASLSISAMPKRTLIALLISFCLSISRIILLKHFMSDVLLGLFIGGYATKWVQVQMEKKNDSIFSKKLVSS